MTALEAFRNFLEKTSIEAKIETTPDEVAYTIEAGYVGFYMFFSFHRASGKLFAWGAYE